MDLTRRTLLGTATLTSTSRLLGRRAKAAGPPVKIGVLNDQSGLYRDVSGPTSVACAQQAVADFGAAEKGLDVQILFADHQNKPDVGANICRQWFDRDGVDMVIDVPNSSVALAVTSIARDKDRVYICSTAATADLTGPACAATTVHWTYDTWMLAHSTGGAMVRAGGDTWFFITADYAFGHALQRDTTNFVKAAGGKVLGSVDAPFPGTDFSSFLIQAQASGAKVIGLCNSGGDTVNSIKQAAEFGIAAGGQKLAGMLVFINDIHALGLPVAHGLVLSESFYWDLNDRTRSLTKRVLQRTKDQYPAMSHAGVYGGTRHYLKAVAAMGAVEARKSGAATVAQMKKMPTEDDAFGAGSIREDGRALHPAYLFEVKMPSESKYAWDYYKLLSTTPADQAFRPLHEGGCPLVKT